MLKIDFDFLNKQIDKIEDTDELSKLYFSVQKIKSKEEKKLLEIEKQFKINYDKLNSLCEKITEYLIKLQIDDDSSDEETINNDESDSSDDDVEINTDDIELISSDSDEIDEIKNK